jgi:Holliday junction DNA helicase RuvA
MYEYIKGKLVASKPNRAVIDVQGVGYAILIPLSTYSRLPSPGHDVHLFISPVVREDAHLLYGFFSQPERDLFDRLTHISGIGPKTAISLIGHMEIADLELAVMQGNVMLLSKVPGIGKKTAERLIVELKGKIKIETSHPLQAENGPIADAISALINLGYHPVAAQKAVQKAAGQSQKTPELSQLITLALRVI